MLDSESSDNTVEIAIRFGARVTTRRFDNWASHQNWALSHLPFKYSWVFYLDADERVSSELATNIREVVSTDCSLVAFRIERRDFYLARWLKHVQATRYYLRLFRPDKMRYERLVNPVSLPGGPVGSIPGYLDHFPFSKGLQHWFERHNSYSTFEAKQICQNRVNNTKFSLKRAFFSKDFHERRFHQKELFYRMPARPLLKFVILYFAKRGFLDGQAGLTYALLQSYYELMIVLKCEELSKEVRSSE